MFIWKSEDLDHWQVESVRIIEVGKETISVATTYKTLKNSIKHDEPLFLVKLYIIRGEHIPESKPFSNNKTIY